jgi:hypothetical protein
VTLCRRAGESGAILLLGLALLLVSPSPARGAEGPEAGPAAGRLAGVTAALEDEVDLLESLWAGRRGLEEGEVVVTAHYLAEAEVRVWRWRAEANQVVAAGLVGSVPAGWEAGADDFPRLSTPGIESGPAPLAGQWVVYRAALERVGGLLQGLEDWLAANAAGLPAPGRTCPVDGPVEFSSTWGEERPWGRTHQGEDLHAAAGTPLVAVESGTILQSGWHWQGGFGVWLAGYYSGDVYYYAHLSWISPEVHPGETVEVGDLLGWVGSTGNATSPHLHFGWIPDDGEHWADLTGLADPYPLLVGLCR